MTQTQKWMATRFTAVAEVVSALAVVIGLLFVGLELRRNTAAVQAATFQGLTDLSNAWIMTIASDEGLSRIRLEGNARPDGLSPVERLQYGMMERAFWVRMQNVYSQYTRGTLTEEDWMLYQAVICGEGSGPSRGELSVWPQQRPILSPGLIELVENCWDIDN